MKMEKTMVTAYISREAKKIIKDQKGLNFSGWLDETIKNSFFSLEQLKLKEDRLSKELEETREEIELTQKYHKQEKKDYLKNLKDMPENEKKWLIETIEILDRDPSFLNGRIKTYKNEYNQDLKKIEFLKLLEDIKKRELNGN